MRKFNIDEILAKYQNLMKEINNKLSNNDWTKETFESPDGSYRYTSFVKVVDLSDFYNQDVDDKKMSKEEYLTYKLQQAVENEDFEEAIKLRDQISNLKSNQEEIEKLELDLKEAIKSQDFEKAIKLRDELKKLK
jgi:excinuclease UvrABC helicase subunit UvrB